MAFQDKTMNIKRMQDSRAWSNRKKRRSESLSICPVTDHIDEDLSKLFWFAQKRTMARVDVSLDPVYSGSSHRGL
jgi:hypothetical protein